MEKVKGRIYKNVIKWLFPVLLVAFSFVGVNRGIDISDTGYNLGNYVYLSKLDGMWYYSTLFSNFVGWLIVRLPGGGTLLGANIYMGLIKASFGLVSYFFFTKKAGFYKEVVFFATLLSFGLWWIPNAGLYHYLSFYLLALGAVLIYEGLFEDNKKKLFAAGVVLAANIFVRFPNLTNAALIVVVWWYSVLKKEKFRDCLYKTLVCIAGYFAALAAVFGIIAVCGKLGNYITAIKELFAMTDDATRYGPFFMIVNLINSYTCVWYWLIPILAGCVVLAALTFLPEKFKIVGYVSAVAGFLAIYLFGYKTGLFDYVFKSYSSIYLFMVVVIIINLVLLAAGLFMKDFSHEVKILCISAIMIQLVTPIGSNNSLYAVMNNLFFILPVSLYVLTEFRKKKMLKFISAGLWFYMLLFLIQAICFRSSFAFRDAFYGEIGAKVSNNKVLAGMKTEEINAVMLTEMTDLWEEYGLKEYSLITFGNNPGLSYVLGSEPAISSTWPLLDSYSTDKFRFQLSMLEDRMASGEKVCVATDGYFATEGKKQDILKDFLDKYAFKTIYDKNNLKIWITED